MSIRYLLDTHTLLWALTDPTRLGAEARRVIAARNSQLLVSAASAWEISTKHRLGKLPQADTLIRGYSSHLRRLGAMPLSITDEHALLAGSLDWQHRDPFDRVLAAQAMSEPATLVTADAALETLPGVTTLW